MTYIQDLSTLDIGAYSNPDLIELSTRIIKQVGADGAWNILEAAGDRLQAEKVRVCGGMVRSSPDSPTTLEQLFFTPPLGDIAYAKNVSIPLIASLIVATGNAGCEIMKSADIGPMTYTEMLQSEVMRQRNSLGGSGQSGIIFGH